MNDNRLRSLTKKLEELPHGSVIMSDETYLKCHPDRMSNDNQCIFVPSYSLGAFSAREVAEMVIDTGYGWYTITPNRED